MRIVAIADQHGLLPEIPECDLLLIGGDTCPYFDESDLFQRLWLDTNFRVWLRDNPAAQTFGIAGNHDWVYQRGHFPTDLPWGYLQDQSAWTPDGLAVWGTPWTPPFLGWAFELAEEGIDFWCRQIPEDTDVILSHGPPQGYGDLTLTGKHVGSQALLTAIERVQPRLVICGHIHEAAGEYMIGETRVLNVSLVRPGSWDQAAEPVVIDL